MVVIKYQTDPNTARGQQAWEIEFRALDDHHVLFVFEEFNLRKLSAGSCYDFIEFKPDLELVPDLLRDTFGPKGSGKICGNISNPVNFGSRMTITETPRVIVPYNTGQQRVDFYFEQGHDDYQSGPNVPSNFTMVVTSYRKKRKCSSYEHDCGGGICIVENLQCDGHINCAFSPLQMGNDEIDCSHGYSMQQQSSRTITIVVMIVVCVVLLICAMVFCTRQTRNHFRSHPGSVIQRVELPLEDSNPRSTAPPLYDTPPPDAAELPPKYEELPPRYQELYPEAQKADVT